MATVSFSPARRWSFFAFIAHSWRHRRWTRAKAICERCAVCIEELDVEALRLFRTGHYRAAVCIARLSLEKELAELCRGLPGWQQTFGQHWVPLMLKHGRITTKQANRISRLYSRCSSVVHGASCSVGRAKGILCDVREMVCYLTGEAEIPEKVVTGFAEGGAA